MVPCLRRDSAFLQLDLGFPAWKLWEINFCLWSLRKPEQTNTVTGIQSRRGFPLFLSDASQEGFHVVISVQLPRPHSQDQPHDAPQGGKQHHVPPKLSPSPLLFWASISNDSKVFPFFAAPLILCSSGLPGLFPLSYPSHACSPPLPTAC